MYGLYYPTGYAPVSRGVAALYNATSRSAWAIAVCWVIVVCATGQGGKFYLAICLRALASDFIACFEVLWPNQPIKYV